MRKNTLLAIISTTFLVVSTLPATAIATGSGWSGKIPRSYYNQGYGDFPPENIEQQLFENRPKPEPIDPPVTTEAEPATQPTTLAAPQPQTNASTTQQYAQPYNPYGGYGYGTHGYQQPNANQYYGNYGYDRYRNYGRNRYRNSGWNAPWDNNNFSFSGPWDNGSWGGNRGGNNWEPWNNNSSGFSMPWGGDKKGWGFW